MKQKVLITMVVIASLLATVAMANGGTSQQTVITVSESFEPNFDRVANYMGYDTEEKFENFHDLVLFMGRYCTTQESFSYIEQMILSGCDPDVTMDIYQFYLTTNEDISIVRQIYDMVYTGEPIVNRDMVFESAFNEITNNKCGVLTEDDIVAYLEKGLTISDISEANLLSRKGIMTIQEILNAVLNGTSWETIVETISNEKINSEFADVNCQTLISALSVANITNEPINTVLETDKEERRIENVTKEINSKLKEKGYWKGKKSDNFELIAKSAKNKGISEEKLTELLDKGYSELDLVNAINDPDCTLQTIDVVVRNEVEER